MKNSGFEDGDREWPQDFLWIFHVDCGTLLPYER